MTWSGTKITERIQNWAKKYKYAAIILLAGLLLLLWPTEEATNGPAGDQTGAFDLSGLERRIETALSEIEGVGQTTVVLTLQSGTERVLAEDWQRDEGRVEESTVVVSRGSGVQEAVTVQEIYPRFQGALVVCAGGNSPTVKLKVLESVSALTGLSSDKISICGRK